MTRRQNLDQKTNLATQRIDSTIQECYEEKRAHASSLITGGQLVTQATKFISSERAKYQAEKRKHIKVDRTQYTGDVADNFGSNQPNNFTAYKADRPNTQAAGIGMKLAATFATRNTKGSIFNS